MINAKNSRETIEWGRLEISSRKLDTKGTFYAKMDTRKDRNDTDLTEAEDMKRWQEYTDLNDPYNQTGVIAYLEPDILDNVKSSGP